MEDIYFLQQVRNALANETRNLNIYVEMIQNKATITEGMWYLEVIINNGMIIRCLAFRKNQNEMTLFFPLPETRNLLLQPTIDEMNNIVKDHYGIGHNK